MTIVSGKVQKVFRIPCELWNYWLFEEHSFISMDQSAYLKRHFTQTSIHRVIDDWLENLNDRAITGVCLLDISKYFDSINHTILLKKIEMYGITSTELKRFSSYLRGRTQVVKFHQETSECCDITCGVPQGSVPGPILLFLFINGISNFAVEASVLNMYADDVIIYTSATSKDELECRLQVCIDNISLIGIVWTCCVLIKRNLMPWLLEANGNWNHWI